MKKRKQKGKRKSETKSSPVTEDKEKNPFDFGGIPKIDLKKNLGCG